MVVKKKPTPPNTKGKKYVKMSDGLIQILRNEYVQGIDTPDGRKYPTTKMLAEMHNLPEKSVQKKCTDFGWADQRSVFEAKLKEESDDKKRREMVEQAVEFDSNNLTIAKSIQAEIGTVINASRNARREAAERLSRPALTEENTESKTRIQKDERERARAEKELRGIPAHNISALANSLAVTQKVGRLAYGDSTENMNVKSSGDAQSELQEAFKLVEQLSGGNPDSRSSSKLH